MNELNLKPIVVIDKDLLPLLKDKMHNVEYLFGSKKTHNLNNPIIKDEMEINLMSLLQVLGKKELEDFLLTADIIDKKIVRYSASLMDKDNDFIVPNRDKLSDTIRNIEASRYFYNFFNVIINERLIKKVVTHLDQTVYLDLTSKIAGIDDSYFINSTTIVVLGLESNIIDILINSELDNNCFNIAYGYYLMVNFINSKINLSKKTDNNFEQLVLPYVRTMV